MKPIEHALAQFMTWDDPDAADKGTDGPTYQPKLTGSELIAELRELFATQRRAEQLICRYLADLADRISQRRDVVLGAYADELHAARCFFGLGVRETRERVRVGRALRNLPRIEQAFIEGDLSYSRAREVTRVATAHTESDWLSLAQSLDMRAFERRVAEARAGQRGLTYGTEMVAADGVSAPGARVAGEGLFPVGALHVARALAAGRGETGASNDVYIACAEKADQQRVRTHWLSSNTVRVTFELSAEAWALVDRALEGARRLGGGGLGDGEALAVVARDALSAQTEGGDASDPRRSVASFATHVGSLRDVGLHATQRETLQPEGSLPPATRLLEVMGRRGGWTMDALIESSGLLAREVAALLTWLELDGKVRSRAGAFETV